MTDELPISGDSRQNWTHHVLRNSTLLIIAGSTITFLSGFYLRTAYFHALGIPEWEIHQTPYEYMAESSSFLLVFSFLALAIGAGAYFVKLAWTRYKGDSLPQVTPTNILAFMASWSVFWLMHKTAEIGDSTPSFGFAPHFTILDGFLYLVGVGFAIVFLILFGGPDKLKEEQNRPSIVPTMQMAYLIIVALVALLLAASMTGQDQANDLVWSCGTHSEIHFNGLSSELEPDGNYTFLFYSDGRYFVRDTAWSGDDRDYLVIPSQAFQTAFVERASSTHDC